MTFRARLVAFLFFLQAASAFAQSAFENTLKLYQSEKGQQLQIYSGKQYTGYSFKIVNNDHAYFQTPAWQKGSLNYGGLKYIDLDLKFDMVKQKLILKDDYRMIELANERIDRFWLDGHAFVRLPTAEDEGRFFEVLAENNHAQLLKFQKKIIVEDISRAVEGVKRSLKTSTEYYLKTTEGLKSINKKKEIIAALGNDFSKKEFKISPDKHFIELFNHLSVQ